ncbi:Type I restriction modification DNA specificity domain protein [anaerobic digester metagenome]
MNFTLANSVNPNRVFLIRKSELEKRLDAEYYTPSLVALEKKVLAKNPKKLRDYVLGIASGATPKTTESELYYTDKENGKPFLRVQNLSPTGILEFEDCKYINIKTHNVMLKRSQVSEGDLLVKITGVGRMAVASVAPEGFEGNINQHICVIKTGSREVSEMLAAFLNSDIGEKLASRRSTGGTRPALDYPALLSIPILYDSRVLAISKKVIEEKKKNEAEAEKLLSGIDNYLLKELGITLPTPTENILKNRIFRTRIKTISGDRFDPYHHQQSFIDIIKAINESKYPTEIFKHLIIDLKNGVEIRNYVSDGGVRYLRVTDLDKTGLNHASPRYVSEQEVPDRIKLNGNCILISRSGSLGLVSVVEPEIENSILSSHIFKVELKIEKILPHFLEAYLRSVVGQSEIFRNNNGGVIPEINQEALKSILISVPPLNKQEEIIKHISEIRKQARQLKDKTKEALKKASEEIEEILIGAKSK